MSRRPIPLAAWALYALGLVALLTVSLSLGGAETTPARWALVSLPVALLAAASLVASRRWPGGSRTEVLRREG